MELALYSGSRWVGNREPGIPCLPCAYLPIMSGQWMVKSLASMSLA